MTDESSDTEESLAPPPPPELKRRDPGENTGFISSLQRMQDKVNMLRRCQMVQMGIKDFFQPA